MIQSQPLDIRQTTNSDGMRIAIDQATVEFIDDTSDSVRITDDCTACPLNLEVGHPVRVSYRPDDPEGATIVPDDTPGSSEQACHSSFYAAGRSLLGIGGALIAVAILCCCYVCWRKNAQGTAAGSTAPPAVPPPTSLEAAREAALQAEIDEMELALAPQQREVRIPPLQTDHKHLRTALDRFITLPWPILSI